MSHSCVLVYEPPLLLASLRRIQNDTTGSRSFCENEHCTAAERVALQLLPRRAAQNGFKKRTISRAEGGQLQAPVGLPVSAHDDVPHASEHGTMALRWGGQR
jgi:hypothetical protein